MNPSQKKKTSTHIKITTATSSAVPPPPARYQHCNSAQTFPDFEANAENPGIIRFHCHSCPTNKDHFPAFLFHLTGFIFLSFPTDCTDTDTLNLTKANDTIIRVGLPSSMNGRLFLEGIISSSLVFHKRQINETWGKKSCLLCRRSRRRRCLCGNKNCTCVSFSKESNRITKKK